VQGRFAQCRQAGTKHEKSKYENPGIPRVRLNCEKGDHEIDCTPDNSDDGSSANRLARANDQKGLIFSRVKDGIVIHGWTRL